MSTIKVSHADSGLIHAEVRHRTRLSPHLIRVTVGGEDVTRFVPLGFDQWVRLALPVSSQTRFDNLAESFGVRGYVKFLTLPKRTRPVIRSYTIREARPESGELDIDFVVHGEDGFAGPWAATAEPGTPLALIDQGCGWAPPAPPREVLLVADESGLPAVAGILRDLPPEVTGHAVVELGDETDRLPLTAPAGVSLDWQVREDSDLPGDAALARLRALPELSPECYAFVVGEQALATGGRRHLVNERGLAKRQVTFCGYWRRGKAYPT